MTKLIKFSYLISSIFILFNIEAYTQSFKIRGNISTDSGIVKFASITFVDNSDTTKKFTAVTDTAGNYQVDVIITEVKDNYNSLPTKFEIEQNYPNPFSSKTTIQYKLNKQSDVNIKIYNILGQEIKSFGLMSQSSGTYGIIWDGTNNFGNKISPGIYFYNIIAGNESRAKKMLFGFSGNKSGSGYFLPLNKNSQSFNGSLKKLGDKTSANTSYSVYIQNTDTTNPSIYYSQFNVLLAGQDTLINFTTKIFDFSICYEAIDSISQSYHVYLNNLNGTHKKDITNSVYYDSYKMWSPDGKYIALCCSGSLYLYDVYKDSLNALLPSNASGGGPLLWTFDSKKIIFIKASQTATTHIVDVDGKNNRQLNYPVTYLYADNYNTLSLEGTAFYHSNLDGTINDSIVDLNQFVKTKSGAYYLCDYNPITNSLLIGFDDPSTTLPNCIALYNIEQRQLDTIIVSDTGWKYYNPKFSTDFKKIALKELRWADDTTLGETNRIAILENGTSSTLVEFRDRQSFLDFSPFSFSKGDKYFAFVKDVLVPGPWVYWHSYLYTVEVATKQLKFIDQGISPIWNPLMLH